MAEKPILFSSEMVRAILDGRKTQTRRVVKPQPPHAPFEFWGYFVCTEGEDEAERNIWRAMCPYGKPGDLLWVRETFSYITKARNERFDKVRPDGCPVEMLYKANADAEGWELPTNWTPSIFMPRWASRLTLRVVDVRVERVQDISDCDILAEGIPQNGRMYDPSGITYSEELRNDFRNLWNSINAKRGYSWSDEDLPDNLKTGHGRIMYGNPWVWVVEFEVAK